VTEKEKEEPEQKGRLFEPHVFLLGKKKKKKKKKKIKKKINKFKF